MEVAAQTEIAREIERVHDEAYGGAVISDDVVVVILDVVLNRASAEVFRLAPR